MVRLLIIKLSSMGDIIHALPVLSDIKQVLGDQVRIDWLTEPHYACLLEEHPLIDNVLTIPLRQYKGHLIQFYRSQEAIALRQYFKAHPYDFILDLQGLMKSALLSRWAIGKRIGYDRHSAREVFSSYCYHKKITVSKNLHAITRMRQLAAQALHYTCPTTAPNYGLNTNDNTCLQTTNKTIMLMPFTTWASKHWPQEHWETLIHALEEKNHSVLIAWGSDAEKIKAQQLCDGKQFATIIPPSSIPNMLTLLKTCQGFVACDTGFAHLATALDIPGVILMGPTDGKKSGPLGHRQMALDINLSCRPCHKRTCHLVYTKDTLQPACLAGIAPEQVQAQLHYLMHYKPS